MLKTQNAFGFPTYFQVSYPNGNKAELQAVHKKVNLLCIPVWPFLTRIAQAAAPEQKTQGTKKSSETSGREENIFQHPTSYHNSS